MFSEAGRFFYFLSAKIAERKQYLLVRKLGEIMDPITAMSMFFKS